MCWGERGRTQSQQLLWVPPVEQREITFKIKDDVLCQHRSYLLTVFRQVCCSTLPTLTPTMRKLGNGIASNGLSIIIEKERIDNNRERISIQFLIKQGRWEFAIWMEPFEWLTSESINRERGDLVAQHCHNVRWVANVFFFFLFFSSMGFFLDFFFRPIHLLQKMGPIWLVSYYRPRSSVATLHFTVG